MSTQEKGIDISKIAFSNVSGPGVIFDNTKLTVGSSSLEIGYHPSLSLGEFDLHIDSCGNLRIIYNGNIVGEFKPSKLKK